MGSESMVLGNCQFLTFAYMKNWVTKWLCLLYPNILNIYLVSSYKQHKTVLFIKDRVELKIQIIKNIHL